MSGSSGSGTAPSGSTNLPGDLPAALGPGAELIPAAVLAGNIPVRLYATEAVTPNQQTLVTFGVPFARGSLPIAALSTVRVLDNGVEIAAHVEAFALWRHLSDDALDGKSIRFVRIQIRRAFAAAPGLMDLSVAWGGSPRTLDVAALTDPRSAWHAVTTNNYQAADGVFEPDVYALLPKQLLSSGIVRLQPMLPLADGVPEARDDPTTMDAQTFQGFDEESYARKNFFYTTADADAAPLPWRTDGEPWLFDRASTMFVLYFRSGWITPLRNAVRAAQFYRGKMWTPQETSNQNVVGLFKLKTPSNSSNGGNDAMYSVNESLAYTRWLVGDDTLADPIRWAADCHDRNDEPTRWSPSLSGWTERHTALGLLSQIIAYESFGEATHKTRITEAIGDYIWHQDGAGGVLSATRQDGGLYHYGDQHGDGVGNALVASTWMTVFVIDAMVRAFALSDRVDVASFVFRAAKFLANSTRSDDQHDFDTFDGPLAHADYMSNIDGTPDPLDGRQYGMVNHSLDIGVGIAWGSYFGTRLGTPEPTLDDEAAALYTTYEVGVKYWTRPGGPAAGLAAYRLSPARSVNWLYRTSGSFTWLLAQ